MYTCTSGEVPTNATKWTCMYTSYNDLLTILLTLREGDKCPTGTDGDAAARPKLSGLSPASWLPATGVDVSEFNSLLSDTILLFSN